MMRYLLLSLFAASASAWEMGKIQDSVVVLGKDTFRKAIEDPANPKWILKFFAPWCGHCKRLAPVLDEVAPKLKGQMAIGTIDCTTEKQLCNEFGVRGYPTLKFSLDGEIHDYTGGRKEGDFVTFAKKLNRPVVDSTASMEAAMKYVAEEADEGVAFVAYHPEVKGGTMDEKIQSTLLTQVFSQVARKERVAGHFLLMDTPEMAEGEDPEPAFVCRIESNIEPRCFENLDGINTVDLHDFVLKQNVATVSKLGPHNFHKVGRKGRPLVIGVVDTDNAQDVAVVKKELANYAINGAAKKKYYFGWFDGKQWSKFLKQFDVTSEDVPQVFVLDVPSKEFWQNATYATDVEALLTAIEDGTIPARTAGKKGFEGVMDRLSSAFVQYRPYSIILLVITIMSFLVIFLSIVSPADYPPLPNEVARASASEAAAAAATTEPKKDK